jgi:transcriptional regulator with XRE-family HTH domain
MGKTRDELTPDVIAVLSRIRKIREERQLALAKVAIEAEISPSYLFYIETFKKVPTVVTLSKLAKALGVEMSDFFID